MHELVIIETGHIDARFKHEEEICNLVFFSGCCLCLLCLQQTAGLCNLIFFSGCCLCHSFCHACNKYQVYVILISSRVALYVLPSTMLVTNSVPLQSCCLLRPLFTSSIIILRSCVSKNTSIVSKVSYTS